MSVDPQPLGPAIELMRRLMGLNHALERVSSRMEAALGVTAQQRMILRCLGRYPGMTPGQLAAQLHVDPGTVSASLRRLEKKKLVVRRRDPRDKRRVSVALTERGRALDRPSNGTVEHAVERLLDTTDPGALETTRQTLATLTRLLEEEHGRG